MFFIAPIVDRFKRNLLRDKLTVDDIANLPVVLAILMIPFPLACRTFFDATRPTQVSLDNYPGYDAPSYFGF